MATEKKYQSFLCPLKDLADKEIHVEGGKITMDIPAFQRGLVWNPAQVEALWDSVLRGIPIGTITLIQYTGAGGDNEATHGVFDGQQRLNALSLGYKNPFDSQSQQEPNESILWLDLMPNRKISGSRKFYLYLTTPGQPWGYKISDSGSETGQQRLSTDEYRKAMEAAFTKDDLHDMKSKPDTRQMWPHQAQCPIPFGLVWKAAQDDGDFKQSLLHTIEEYGKGHAWYEKKTQPQLSKLQDSDLTDLETGLRNAKAATAVVVISPQTFDRNLGSSDETQAETDVAVFFSRLNRGGSVPSSEDVNYSILKSIMPALASIDTLANNRMTPSRLAAIAMRLYLTERENHWRANVSRKDVYLLASDSGFKDYVKEDGILAERMKKLEDMLLWNEEDRGNGIPAYILSSVILKKQELYVFFLSIVEQYYVNKDSCLSVFMLMALFGNDIVYANAFMQREGGLKHLLYYLVWHNQLLIPPTPDIYVRIHEVTQKKQYEALDEAWNPALYKFALDKVWYWSNFEARMLLLYACRNYIGKTFGGYDPANAVWKEDNCPWDYDHIFPQNWLIHGRGYPQGKYHGEAHEFINCIGNIAPIPYARNREKQDNPPYTAEYHYMGIDEDVTLFTNLSANDPKPVFLQKKPKENERIEHNLETTLELGCLVARRMERIYRECYDTLRWNELLDFTDFDCERRELFDRFRVALRAQGAQEDECPVWAIAHRGLQKQIQQPSDWGRDWLACGIPVEYVDASGNQRKGLACIRSNGQTVEWGMRRHPDETSVDGDSNAWWLPNTDNSADWPEGKICKTCQMQEVDDDKMQEIAGAVVSLINARRVH